MVILDSGVGFYTDYDIELQNVDKLGTHISSQGTILTNSNIVTISF